MQHYKPVPRVKYVPPIKPVDLSKTWDSYPVLIGDETIEVYREHYLAILADAVNGTGNPITERERAIYMYIQKCFPTIDHVTLDLRETDGQLPQQGPRS